MITDYASLQTTAARYLNRGDLAADLPTFVQMAERRLSRDIEGHTAHVNVPVNAGDLTTLLPGTAYGIVRSLLWADDGRERTVYGRILPDATGGSVIYYDPAPEVGRTLVVEHYPALTPLSDTNTTNPVLLRAPDAYLYAVLLEATPFLVEDERIPTWATAYQNAVDGYNREISSRQFVAASMPLPYGGF